MALFLQKCAVRGKSMKLHKVLLVDGDVNILGVLKIRLGLMGYDVTAVEDADKAIACLEREQFSLMLTDQCLGKSSGIELMKIAHQKDPFMSVIIMTAYGSIDDAVSALQNGAYTYLEKPLDIQELSFHIQNAIQQREIRKKLAIERKLWSGVLVNIGSGLILIDEKKTVSWSCGLEKRIFRKEIDSFSLRGKELDEILEKELSPSLISLIDIASQSDVVQTLIYESQDRALTYLIIISPVKQALKKKHKIALLFLDISKAKQIPAFQVEQERFKGVLEMAGAVAHELSQPVQSIVGWGEILQKGLDESDPNYETLKRISAQIETVSNLLSRLTSITRYVIKEYPGSTTIIDIEKASSPKKTPSSS